MKKACTVAIVDALGSGSGVRYSSRDAVGSGPRRVAGILESGGLLPKIMLAEDVINRPNLIDSYNLLMVSAMSTDIRAAKRIVEIWRSRRRDKPAIIGGPIASQPKELLLSGYDTVVVGEGENSLLQMLRTGLTNCTLSKQFRRAILVDGISQELEYGNQTLVRSLQHASFNYAQKRDVLNRHEPSTVCIVDYPSHLAMRFYVEVVRGCSNFLRTSIPLKDGKKCIDCQKCRSGEPNERIECPTEIPPGCGFCDVPALFGPPRSRDASKIVEEVTGLVKSGVRRIVLSASDFLDYEREKLVAPQLLTDPSYPPSNTNEIESLLSQLTSLPKRLSVPESDYVYMSVENIKSCLFDDEVASIIAEYLPNSTIHLGCETGSEEHSKRLGRPSTPRQTLEAVKVAVRHGLRPYVYFIHGLPGQTARTTRDTVELMQELFEAGTEKLTIYKFKPLPLSAFAKFPPAPPARMDKNSKKIERTTRRLNLESKSRLVGKTIDVIASASVREDRRDGTITYPVMDGPVVLISGETVREGERLKVKITEVLSDRLVRGERS
jgi:radical SAM superfamily enzyme YgiQ (UPF0313 family)